MEDPLQVDNQQIITVFCFVGLLHVFIYRKFLDSGSGTRVLLKDTCIERAMQWAKVFRFVNSRMIFFDDSAYDTSPRGNAAIRQPRVDSTELTPLFLAEIISFCFQLFFF